MSVAGRYLAGLAAVAGVTLAASAVMASDTRRAVRVALALALCVQGPLGWWLVRAIGRRRERFLAVWGVGFASRLALLGVTALVVAPALGWPLAPLLVSLAALLVALLWVESFVLLSGGEGGR